MTFVIKENFENIGYVNKDFDFDIEGYDYILNKNNIFTEGDLVRKQYEKLQFILKKYEELDPTLLESLHFKNSQGKMSLHLALESKNTRTVNMVIDYMSKISFAACFHFKDILKYLVTYKNFESYLANAPFTTVQMLNKQTISLIKKEENEILVTSSSPCQYIDDAYFEKTLKESESRKAVTYSVQFKCIRADFLINHGIGVEFMQEMIRQKRMSLFNTPYMMLLT